MMETLLLQEAPDSLLAHEAFLKGNQTAARLLIERESEWVRNIDFKPHVLSNVEYSLYYSFGSDSLVLGLTFGDNDTGDFGIRRNGRWCELDDEDKEFIFSEIFSPQDPSVVRIYDELGPGKPTALYR